MVPGRNTSRRLLQARITILGFLCVILFINIVISKRIKSPLERRLDAHFNEYLLRSAYITFLRVAFKHLIGSKTMSLVNVRLDVPTFHDPIVKAKLAQIAPKYSVGQAWRVFSGVINVLSAGVGIASELYVLLSLLRGEEGGGLFVILATVRPVLDIFNVGGSWPQGTLFYSLITKNISNFYLVFYVYVTNKVYYRMKRLSRLASDDSYRKHVVADGLQDYITDGTHVYSSLIDLCEA